MSIVYSDTITVVNGPVTSQFACEVKDHFGRIECNCPTYKYLDRNWCDHVQRVITENLDRDTFLYKPTNDNPVLVMVPVVPTDGFWMMVVLSDLNKTGMYLATVNLSDAPDTDDFDVDTRRTVELGVVLYGHEGRSALRRMVLGWLGEAGRGMYCTAGTHNQMALSRSRPFAGNSSDLKHVFSLLNNGVCESCLGFTTFDDDVPEI